MHTIKNGLTVISGSRENLEIDESQVPDDGADDLLDVPYQAIVNTVIEGGLAVEANALA